MALYTYQEGRLFAWTGGTEPSTPVGYVEDIYAAAQRQYENVPMVDGSYTDILVGERIDISFTTQYVPEYDIWDMFMSAQPVHIRLDHRLGGESAGLYAYSGRFSQAALRGGNTNPLYRTINFHSNKWSGYGES